MTENINILKKEINNKIKTYFIQFKDKDILKAFEEGKENGFYSSSKKFINNTSFYYEELFIKEFLTHILKLDIEENIHEEEFQNDLDRFHKDIKYVYLGWAFSDCFNIDGNEEILKAYNLGFRIGELDFILILLDKSSFFANKKFLKEVKEHLILIEEESEEEGENDGEY
jgi:hypothetical protein